MNRLFITTALITVAATAPLLAVDPAPLPAKVRTAKKIFVTNQGIHNYIYDRVYDRLRKWPRFVLVEERAQADLVAVVTERNQLAGAAAMPVGTAQIMVPLASSRKYLILLDASTGEQLLYVDTPEGILLSRTAKALVDRLKERFPKSER